MLVSDVQHKRFSVYIPNKLITTKSIVTICCHTELIQYYSLCSPLAYIGSMAYFGSLFTS